MSIRRQKKLDATEQEIKKYNYTERNSFQDRLIKAGLLYTMDQNNYEHCMESLKRLHELSKPLIDFKRDHLSGDSLSPRKTKMLERIRNMRDIIAQETQKKA